MDYIHMNIIQSHGTTCVPSAEIMNQLSTVPVPRDKIWVSQGPLWRLKQVTSNRGEIALLTAFGKILSNLSYASLTPEDLNILCCGTWKLATMKTEITHASNSDEPAQDCTLPAPKPAHWWGWENRLQYHIVLCESSTQKTYNSLPFPIYDLHTILLKGCNKSRVVPKDEENKSVFTVIKKKALEIFNLALSPKMTLQKTF